MIREAVSILKEADEDAASGSNTRRGAVGEFKIAAYCCGADPIVNDATYKAAVKLSAGVGNIKQVLDNATTKANNYIGSKSSGHMYYEAGTTKAQAEEAGQTEKNYKEKIDGIEEDAQEVAEMMRAWYHDVEPGKNAPAIPAKDLRLDVSDNTDQGDIYVTKKKKTYPWSLKVQGSQAGQQNLGASDLSNPKGKVKWDYKQTIMDTLVDWFKNKDKKVAGIVPGAQVKKNLKLGSKKKNYVLNKTNEITAIDYKYWRDNGLTGVIGKAMALGLINNALSVKGITMIMNNIVANSHVGKPLGADTLIGSPSAYKDWKKGKGVTSTDDLFPGLKNIVTKKTKMTQGKILIHRSKNPAQRSTLHVAYGSTKNCNKVATGRLWRMSLRKSGVSGGFQAGISFNVLPPTRKGTHTYLTIAATKKKILSEELSLMDSLLLENEAEWVEYELDDAAAEEDFQGDYIDLSDEEEVGEFFLDNGTVADLGLVFEPEEEFEMSPAEEAQACSIAANECGVEGGSVGDEADEGDEGDEVHDESDEALTENRLLKLAGLLKD